MAIKNRWFIDDRQSIVDDKTRIGDWEIDTIIGKGHKQAIVSILDRVSKNAPLRKVKHKIAENVKTASLCLLKPISDTVHTITGDNGSEFAKHKKIAKALGADFYFAHPYSSWERGPNKNTNGFVQQHLKKGSDFSKITNGILDRISEALNNQPRKTLGYHTPNEVFYASE